MVLTEGSGLWTVSPLPGPSALEPNSRLSAFPVPPALSAASVTCCLHSTAVFSAPDTVSDTQQVLNKYMLVCWLNARTHGVMHECFGPLVGLLIPLPTLHAHELAPTE